ncbi:hypothetical protein AB0G74_18990 [Streptomyces sp. NPDC020875]|uniref:hypothetical protein n=1 Tax=Streptomyces sp. NPDC020875 TaxID=3154898 RepID=UPI0033D6D841
MALVTFVDETTSGDRSDGWGVEIFEERLALRELIRRRVFQEVAEARAGSAVRPRPYNGSAPAPAPDPEAETAAALRAFERNGFLVLVAERQLTGLDDEVELRPGTEVVFLRLVPLVGG